MENVRVNSHINKVCCLLKVVWGPQGRMVFFGFLVVQSIIRMVNALQYFMVWAIFS